MGRETEDMTDEHCKQFIREGFGLADLEVEVLDKEVWCMRVQIAERFREGHIFLAGDYRDTNGDFLSVYGIDSFGAVLVRPDGHVMWRAHSQQSLLPALDYVHR